MLFLKQILVLSIVTVVLSGCAATGSKYQPQSLDAIPQNKGLITFYRPKTFVGSGVLVKLVDNGEVLGTIQHGQFVKHYVEPGKHTIHTKTAAIDKPSEINIEAGQQYFMKTILKQGLWVNSYTLSRVYEEEALIELEACCKSGKIKEQE